MEGAYLEVISWLENSGYMPEEARDDIDCAKENIPGTLQHFFDAFRKLSQNDYHDPEDFRTNLLEMKVQFMGLRGDLQDIENALRKTVINGHHSALIEGEDE